MLQSPLAYRFMGLSAACLLFCLLAVPVARAGGDEWRPVDPAELALKTPVVERDADAEALFWEVRVNDSGDDLVFNNYIRIKIFTERGRESQSRIDIIPFRPNTRIKDVFGRTIKPDGTIIELKKEDVFEKIIAKAGDVKLRAKTFALPAVEPGAIIEYRWREVYPNSSANYTRLHFQRDIPVHSIKYLIKPSSHYLGADAMRSQPFGMQTPKFEKEKDGYYSTTLQNVAAYHEEPRMPPADEVRAWLLVYYSDAREPNVEKYWKEFGKGLYDVFKDDLKPKDEVKQKAATIVGDATTPEQKLERLYEFCRTQIKNVSDDASGLTADDRAKLKDNKSAADTLKRGQGTAHGCDLSLRRAGERRRPRRAPRHDGGSQRHLLQADLRQSLLPASDRHVRRRRQGRRPVALLRSGRAPTARRHVALAGRVAAGARARSERGPLGADPALEAGEVA